MTTQTDKRSKEYYNEELKKAPENYERYFVPVIGKPVAEDLIRLASLQPNEKVLDVGCGTGIVTRLAAHKVGSNGSVTGLDINPGMLSVARSTTSPEMSIEWTEASAESIPFSDETFDVVLCQLSLQFVENKSAALKEMQRVLVPGGRLILNVPGSAGELFVIFIEAVDHHISAEAAEFAEHVFSLHDTGVIQRLMSDANFNGINITEKAKTLTLPAPKEFLWQYINSTPLIEVVSKINKEARDALEREIVDKWQKFEKNGSMVYQQQVISASAQK